MLFINFGLFFNYYFYHYNSDNMDQFFFATYYLDALNYSKNLDKENIHIQSNLTVEEYIYPLLFNNISPYDFDKYIISTSINDKITIYNFIISDQIDSDVYIVNCNTSQAKN